MITIENLTKFYGKNRAVNDISFTINDNEILGFLGPNGAGKSTTMNMITGFLPMSGGKVMINGTDISENPVKAKRNIGYLPEIPPVYPDMKVTEYLDFCAGLKGIKGGEKKKEMERVMKLLKITDVSHKLIRNLSKGYKQRVGFAQALLGDPKFLILDEPTVGLDPNQVVEVRSIIKDLKKGHSVIFSSHILSEVSAVCDRVIIINKGEIRAIDTIANLERSINSSDTLHIRTAGSKAAATAIIQAAEGVKEIMDIEDEGNNITSFTVQFDAGSEDISEKLLNTLISNQVSVLEVFTDKPDLEKVFTELINRPIQKKSLEELLNEIVPESDESKEQSFDKNVQNTEKEEDDE